jgi:hypothetical protein
MAVILPRTVRRAAEAALSLHSVPPRAACHFARSLGGVSSACSSKNIDFSATKLPFFLEKN